jgi:predicted 3-demethylubiquinone-9 3-methyltransferase (glyoxalase superfamily)
MARPLDIHSAVAKRVKTPAKSILPWMVPMSAAAHVSSIAPFLWFDKNAEEAVTFYLSIFKNSRQTGKLVRQADDPGGAKGSALTISFELDGLPFTAMNGGPGHPFNDAVSFFVRCEDQSEIDHYWEKLTEGGNEIACGWLKDKFGLCWQIVPTRIMELIRHPKAMQAMMQMKKLDIAVLEQAGRS